MSYKDRSVRVSPFIASILKENVKPLARFLVKWFYRMKKDYYIFKKYGKNSKEYLETRKIKIEHLPWAINYWETYLILRYIYCRYYFIDGTEDEVGKLIFNVPFDPNDPTLTENKLLEYIDDFYKRTSNYKTELKETYLSYESINEVSKYYYDYLPGFGWFNYQGDYRNNLLNKFDSKLPFIIQLGNDLIFVSRYEGNYRSNIKISIFNSQGIKENEYIKYIDRDTETCMFAYLRHFNYDNEEYREIVCIVYSSHDNSWTSYKFDLNARVWMEEPYDEDVAKVSILAGWVIHYFVQYNDYGIAVMEKNDEDKIYFGVFNRSSEGCFDTIEAPEEFIGDVFFLQITRLSNAVLFYNPINNNIIVLDPKNLLLSKVISISNEFYKRNILLPETENSCIIASINTEDWFSAICKFLKYYNIDVDVSSVISYPSVHNDNEEETNFLDVDTTKISYISLTGERIPCDIPYEVLRKFFTKAIYPTEWSKYELDLFFHALAQDFGYYQASTTASGTGNQILSESIIEEKISQKEGEVFLPIFSWNKIHGNETLNIFRIIYKDIDNMSISNVDFLKNEVLSNLVKIDQNLQVSLPYLGITILPTSCRSSWLIFSTVYDTLIASVNRNTIELFINKEREESEETYAYNNRKNWVGFLNVFSIISKDYKEYTIFDPNFYTDKINELKNFIKDLTYDNYNELKPDFFYRIMNELIYNISILIGENIDLSFFVNSDILKIFRELLRYFLPIHSRLVSFRLNLIIDSPDNSLNIEDKRDKYIYSGGNNSAINIGDKLMISILEE